MTKHGQPTSQQELDDAKDYGRRRLQMKRAEERKKTADMLKTDEETVEALAWLFGSKK